MYSTDKGTTMTYHPIFVVDGVAYTNQTDKGRSVYVPDTSSVKAYVENYLKVRYPLTLGDAKFNYS